MMNTQRSRRRCLWGLALIVALAITQPGSAGGDAADEAMSAIRPEAIRGDMRSLSDDLLEGGGTGTRGYELAAKFMATQCETLGLQPLVQDQDWADEVLHARIGRKWLVPDLGSQKKTMECGDIAWSRVPVDWTKWREDGLTQHRNWWPEIYRAACRHWNIAPDPKVVAYSMTYEGTRADLKSVHDWNIATVL